MIAQPGGGADPGNGRTSPMKGCPTVQTSPAIPPGRGSVPSVATSQVQA
ncbi:MAG: hypothetical protein AAFU61_03820 [Pseudomonadota bacterium]